MPQENAGRARQLDAFLGWLLGRASQSACDANGDSRALRKRTAWCWNVRPVIPPPMVKHHVFCQIFVGRFGVSFSPFERLFLGRFGFGQSCGLSVIA